MPTEAAATHIGALRMNNGQPLVIDGLWDLKFGVDAGGFSSSVLYFTAGPDEELHGVFGRLEPAAVNAPAGTGGAGGVGGSGTTGAGGSGTTGAGGLGHYGCRRLGHYGCRRFGHYRCRRNLLIGPHPMHCASAFSSRRPVTSPICSTRLLAGPPGASYHDSWSASPAGVLTSTCS